MTNPSLGEKEKEGLTRRLMSARRAVRDAKQDVDPEAEAAAQGR